MTFFDEIGVGTWRRDELDAQTSFEGELDPPGELALETRCSESSTSVDLGGGTSKTTNGTTPCFCFVLSYSRVSISKSSCLREVSRESLCGAMFRPVCRRLGRRRQAFVFFSCLPDILAESTFEHRNSQLKTLHTAPAQAHTFSMASNIPRVRVRFLEDTFVRDELPPFNTGSKCRFPGVYHRIWMDHGFTHMEEKERLVSKMPCAVRVSRSLDLIGYMLSYYTYIHCTLWSIT